MLKFENEILEYISRCYREILNRDPDPEGLNHYSKELKGKRISKDELVLILKSSKEYLNLQNKNPMSNLEVNKDIKDVTTLTAEELNSKSCEENLVLLKDYFKNCTIVPGPKDELLGYVEDAFFRFIKTLQMIPQNNTGTLLEIGSNPYFITILLSKFRKFQLNGCNFFSTTSNSLSQTIINQKYGERFDYTSKLFNIEKSNFLYESESFDYILFCEVIEHLVEDPIHVLGEIHRVLRPNGTLILTTPNVARASNIQKLEKGENIYDPYSRYGIYGRHNREYTINELKEILSNTGFQVNMGFTKFVHFDKPDSNWWTLSDTDNLKGDYIFISASKRKKFDVYRPSWLFR